MNAPVPQKSYRSSWEKVLGVTESPIESAFLQAFCERAIDAGYQVGTKPTGDDTIAVQTQKMVDRYRLDFVVWFAFHGADLQLAVECDGHEYHRSKRHMARDKRRDRVLTSLGYVPIRFTGSELHSHPAMCAAEVLDLVMDFQTARIVQSMSEVA